MKNLKIVANIIFVLILELVFSCTTIGEIGNIWLKILFSIIIALGIDLVSNLFPKKVNKILYIINQVGIILVFFIYEINYKLFGNILTLNSLINAIKEATPFASIIPTVIIQNWYILLALIIILILSIFLNKYLDFERKNKKYILVELVLIIIIYIVAIFNINIFSNNNINSAKNLYYNVNNNIQNCKQFGLLTTIRLDIQRIITKFEEKDIANLEENTNIIANKDTYNMQDIDFDKIEEETENAEIKEICEYIKSQEPTNKNEYTGIYKGKNIIFFVAESFSNEAIREDITPTLYKLKNEGIKFNNFYTPLFPVSTSDGEYVIDTSLLPADGKWSMEEVKNNSYPYTYANILKNQGYEAFAYHNYNYDYYKRNEYFPTMGYNKYLAYGNGLEKRMNFDKGIASDYEMVRTTIDDYINEENFIAYYMTISGHMEYTENHAMVQKNWDKVKNLPYSYKVKAYLATQIELDRAVQEVIERLTKAGKLDSTVIIITGDHYPYGLTLEERQELTDLKIDEEFEQYNMPLIIYNSGQTEKIESNKYCSSLDILPTMLNLLGANFDSRLLMGGDIFSKSKDLVIFADRSFITDQGRYNEITESYSGKQVEHTYVSDIKQIIYKKFRYSRLILKNNFYNYIEKYIN